MNEWLVLAKDVLKEQVKGQKEGAMAPSVRKQLTSFCEQNEEFAQAVAQGGSFIECMEAVAKNAGNSISDLDAYKKAVSFYFPGAEIHCEMTIAMCASEAPKKKPAGLVVSLDSFF